MTQSITLTQTGNDQYSLEITASKSVLLALLSAIEDHAEQGGLLAEDLREFLAPTLKKAGINPG